MLFIYYVIFFQLIAWPLRGVMRFFETRNQLIKKIFVFLDQAGTYFHEVAHYLICRMFVIKLKSLKIKINENKRGGSMTPVYDKGNEPGFFIELLISMAPATVGAVCLLYLIPYTINFHADGLLYQYAGLIVLMISIFSILLSSLPSSVDYILPFRTIAKYPGLFVKDICTISISLVFLFGFWDEYQRFLPLPFPWFEIIGFLIPYFISEIVFRFVVYLFKLDRNKEYIIKNAKPLVSPLDPIIQHLFLSPKDAPAPKKVTPQTHTPSQVIEANLKDFLSD